MEGPYEDATIMPSILPSMNEYEMMRELELGQFELWKSSLNFTGDNPEFPVEIFTLIMEKKYKLLSPKRHQISKQKHFKACTRALKHIEDGNNTPAGLWKQKYLRKTSKEEMAWPKIKEDLIEHFGRKSQSVDKGHCYSLQEQLILFNSLLKGQNETFSTFCVRVNAVTRILEHGNICSTRKPSEHWTKLFFLIGLGEEDRNLVLRQADDSLKIKDMCALLLNQFSANQKQQLNPNIPDHLKVDSHRDCDIYSNQKLFNVIPKNEGVSISRSAKIENSDMCDHDKVSDDSKTCSSIMDKDYIEDTKCLPEQEEQPGDIESQNDCDIDSFSHLQTLPPHSTHEDANFEAMINVPIQPSNNLAKGVAKQQERNEVLCLICNKSFASRKLLKNHNQELHPNDKITKCPHCEFERFDKRSVIIHIQRTHSDDRNFKPYQCTQCSKSYRFNFKLTAHCRLAHGEGGIYKCDQCSYRCDQKNRLQEHVDGIHGKKKNFKCVKCDFSTSWRRGLTTHLWVLHGEGKGRVYTCEQCGYTTKVQSLYRNHLMNLHNIGEYKPGLCPICGMTFKTKSYLMDHMYKVHKKTLKGKDTKAAAKDQLQTIPIHEDYKNIP